MTIVVIGLGLIGGSLVGACRRKFPKARIIGVTRNRAALGTAKKRGWIHEGFPTIEIAFRTLRGFPPHRHCEESLLPAEQATRATKQSLRLLRPQLGAGLAMTGLAPFVILCTPVNTLKNFLIRLDRTAPPGTVVTDTGSVKGFLVRWAGRRKWRRIHFVGAHPMAGSHERGIGAADPDLFKESLTFVTPGTGSLRTGTGEPVLKFWKRISSRVVVISAAEHDRVTAEISHLPHLLAATLVAGVSGKSLPFASSGFLDTTRIAQADPGLWAPIFLENRRELYRALRNLEVELRQFKKLLLKRDPVRLKRFLARTQSRRARIKLISKKRLL